MKGYTYYTVTLANTAHAGGITGGSITYSEIMCGDHLTTIRECGCKI